MFVVVRMPDGSSHRLEALEGWRVMEVIRDWGLAHQGGMRRRLRLRHLPCLGGRGMAREIARAHR